MENYFVKIWSQHIKTDSTVSFHVIKTLLIIVMIRAQFCDKFLYKICNLVMFYLRKKVRLSL
jgi:hypothetical protein